jgi:hypothetical protein
MGIGPATVLIAYFMAPIRALTLPQSIWTRLPSRSLRLTARRGLGLGLARDLRPAVGLRVRQPGLYLLVGLAIPTLVSLLAVAAGLSSPAALPSESIGTLWQVEGALVGLAIAVALYGYEALGRHGAIRPDELAGLRLPRALYFGIALVILTGAAYFLGTEGLGTVPEWRSAAADWYSFWAVAMSLVWAVMLIQTLPEAVAVADPGFRTALRLRRLRTLAREAVERRLVELAAVNILIRRAALRGCRWTPWILSVDTVREIRPSRDGYLWDVDLAAIDRLLRPGSDTEITLRLESRILPTQAFARGAAQLDQTTRSAWDHALALRKDPPGEPIGELLSGLRETALISVRGHSSQLKSVVDAWVDCLETFAATWERHVGQMGADQLHEPITVDRSPLGQIIGATRDAFEEAVRSDDSDAVALLSYLPTRIADLGLRYNAPAYFGALDAYISFYWSGVHLAAHDQAAAATRAWTYLADFLQWSLALAGRRGSTRDSLIEDAERAARRVVVSIGHEMINRRDLIAFKELADRLGALRDD